MWIQCSWYAGAQLGESITHPGFFELIEGLLLLFASQAFLLLVQREIRARLRVVRVRRALKSDKSSIRFNRHTSLTSWKFQNIETNVAIDINYGKFSIQQFVLCSMNAFSFVANYNDPPLAIRPNFSKCCSTFLQPLIRDIESSPLWV